MGARLRVIALALLLSLVGGALQAEEAFQSGINVLLHKEDAAEDFDWEVQTLLDRLHHLHVSSIALVWPVYTEGVTSNEVFRGPKTPADEDLSFLASKAAEAGFTVIMRPIIDEQVLMAENKNEWRGTIRPSDPQAWFQSYSKLILEYVSLASISGAGAFDVGTELDSMEKYPDSWRNLIARIRGIYEGQLTYSSNQGISDTIPWDALDFISIDAFFSLESTSADATTDDMVRAWKKWVPMMVKTAADLKKPLVLTEIGSASQFGAHRRSWIWNHRSTVNLEDQRRYYEAACIAWKPHLIGMYWWVTQVWISSGSAADGTFSPIRKPAEQEIKICYE